MLSKYLWNNIIKFIDHDCVLKRLIGFNKEIKEIVNRLHWNRCVYHDDCQCEFYKCEWCECEYCEECRLELCEWCAHHRHHQIDCPLCSERAYEFDQTICTECLCYSVNDGEIFYCNTCQIFFLDELLSGDTEHVGHDLQKNKDVLHEMFEDKYKKYIGHL